MNPYFLFILGLIGLGITFHITKKKKSGAPVCKPGEHCDVIIYSKYAYTKGVDNLKLGGLYYSFIVLLAVGLIMIPSFFTQQWISWLSLTLTALAVLFSAYLTYLQAFILKARCKFCVASAITSLLIFLTIILA